MQLTFLTVAALGAALWFALLLAIHSAAFRAGDLRILTFIHARFKPGESRAAHKVQRAMRDLTALGGDMVAAVVLLCGSLLVMAYAGESEALWFAGVIVTARLVGLAIKLAVRRQRPQIASEQLRSFTSSFPSVHTLMSFAVTFALLGVIGMPFSQSLLWAGAMAAMIGGTRLYFAVHWPSDVAAGWLAGLAICSLAANLGRF